MTNKEAKAILIKKLGEKQFKEDFDRYYSFGWNIHMVLDYMLMQNKERDFFEAMRDSMYN